MNRNPDRTRLADVLVELAIFLVISGVLVVAFGVLGAVLTGAVGSWAVTALRVLRSHRRSGQPLTTAVLRDAALLRLHSSEPPFKHASRGDLARVFKIRRGNRNR